MRPFIIVAGILTLFAGCDPPMEESNENQQSSQSDNQPPKSNETGSRTGDGTPIEYIPTDNGDNNQLTTDSTNTTDNQNSSAVQLPYDEARAAVFAKLKEFKQGINDDDSRVQAAAIDNFLPTRQDVIGVFGEDGASIWPRIATFNSMFREEFETLRQDFAKFDETATIEDMRKTSKESSWSRKIAPLIPQDMHVFQVEIVTEKTENSRETISIGPFYSVNGKMVYIQH